MFQRQRTGSVVCPACGRLVGVNDRQCGNCGRWNPGLWGFAPLLRRLGQDLGFVQLILWGCGALYVATLFFDPQGIRSGGLLTLLAPSPQALVIFGASGAVPVFELGRWWTLLSAAWLHGGLLHIGFNLLWVRHLGPATAEAYGPGRAVIVYTLSAVGGFGASTLAGAFLPALPFFLRGAWFTVGASAPIFGLLGALVWYGRRGGSSLLGRQALGYAVALFLIGFLLPGVDNYAHLGGFVTGYLAGRWFDPLLPERLDHLLGALVCLGASGLSVAVSIAHGLSLLR